MPLEPKGLFSLMELQDFIEYLYKINSRKKTRLIWYIPVNETIKAEYILSKIYKNLIIISTMWKTVKQKEFNSINLKYFQQNTVNQTQGLTYSNNNQFKI